MAHELTSTDVLLLNQEKAWHGLGTVIQEDLGAVEGGERVGLLWEVDQLIPTVELPSGRSMLVNDVRMNVRRDTETLLGCVSDNWKPVQNRQLAEFCDALADAGQVKIETCGSIRGGKKVWFLCKGESFFTSPADEVASYICVSNGFDGKTGIRVTPTEVRVVCSNTLHMVIPTYDGSRFKVDGENGYSCSHVGDLMKRVTDVKNALNLYNESREESAQRASKLASQQVSRAELAEYFLDLYSRHVCKIDAGTSKKKKEKSEQAFLKFMNRFEREQNLFGGNRWIMANAYSGWIQHDFGRTKNGSDSKISKNLFGSGIDRSDEAFALALAI